MQDIPMWVYAAVGMIVITNVGTLITLIILLMKASWWASKVDSRVSSNKKDINNAHNLIRDNKAELKQDIQNNLKFNRGV